MQLDILLLFSYVCHAICLTNMLKIIQISQDKTTKIFMDDILAIALSKNLIFYDKSKKY